MSISVTNKARWIAGSLTAYVLLALLCVAVDRVYGLFGHGVASLHMSLMFLYPLMGGVLWLAAGAAAPRRPESGPYRAGLNLYNSGLAALTAAALLDGILDIAGAASPYVRFFYIAGGLLAAAGYAVLLRAVLRRRG